MESLNIDLSKPKMKNITAIIIDEFAERGYELASTNEIVKKSGIAKGTLFNNFLSKEKMFLFVANHVYHEIRGLFFEKVRKFSGDIFGLNMLIAETEFEMKVKRQSEFTLFSRSFLEKNTDFGDIIGKNSPEKLKRDFYTEILDHSGIKIEKGEAQRIEIIRWTVRGIKEKYDINRAAKVDAEISGPYFKEIRDHFEILKKLYD